MENEEHTWEEKEEELTNEQWEVINEEWYQDHYNLDGTRRDW